MSLFIYIRVRENCGGNPRWTIQRYRQHYAPYWKRRHTKQRIKHHKLRQRWATQNTANNQDCTNEIANFKQFLLLIGHPPALLILHFGKSNVGYRRKIIYVKRKIYRNLMTMTVCFFFVSCSDDFYIVATQPWFSSFCLISLPLSRKPLYCAQTLEYVNYFIKWMLAICQMIRWSLTIIISRLIVFNASLQKEI